MVTVKISNNAFPKWPLLRQTPNASGIWGACKFHINDDSRECDYWVVYGELKSTEVAYCPPENTILITTEPSSIEQYSSRFLSQFATIITCHRGLEHSNVIYGQQGLPWHVGKVKKGQRDYQFSSRYDYDVLKQYKSFTKTKEISVIASNKTITEGHKKRFEFVKQIAEHFGLRMDVFGQGVRDIDDKWDAIADYKYHIVIENSSFPDYWTEKLTDCYLGGAYPFYYGCTNIQSYFPQEAFSAIDINDVGYSIEIIEKALAADVYAQSTAVLDVSRNLVLDRFNLFALINEHIAASAKNSGQKEKVIIVPEKHTHGAGYILRRKWAGIVG